MMKLTIYFVLFDMFILFLNISSAKPENHDLTEALLEIEKKLNEDKDEIFVVNLQDLSSAELELLTPSTKTKKQSVEEDLKSVLRAYLRDDKNDGEAESDADGVTDGVGNGETDGVANGETDGVANGETDGVADGETDGVADGETDVEAYDDVDGKADGKGDAKNEGMQDNLSPTLKQFLGLVKNEQYQKEIGNADEAKFKHHNHHSYVPPLYSTYDKRRLQSRENFILTQPEEKPKVGVKNSAELDVVTFDVPENSPIHKIAVQLKKMSPKFLYIVNS